MSKLIFRSFQSPGDILMLTSAVRDLHSAYPGKYITDVRTSASDLWQNNPHITPLNEHDADVSVIEMHYPLIHQSNQRPYHFLHGYTQFLEQHLDVRIPVTQFRGDVYLTEAEKSDPIQGADQGLTDPYWIIVAGGKYDFTAKWWNPSFYQEVVNHFQGKIQFVQCGEAGHWHPPLDNVVNLVGQTNLREFLQLTYHAEGVLCPVTFAMHAAAAVKTKLGKPPERACVVVAGAREPVHWEAYPFHQYLSTLGTLSCCAEGGCWKSRCQLVEDGDSKNRHNICEQPVQIQPDLRIPQCMQMITPADVIRRVELYYAGGLLKYKNEIQKTVKPSKISVPVDATIGTATERGQSVSVKKAPPKVLVQCCQSNGNDVDQIPIVLRHLKHYHADWQLELATTDNQLNGFQDRCRSVKVVNQAEANRIAYDWVIDLDWRECELDYPNWPNNRATRCLLEELKLTPIPCLYPDPPDSEFKASTSAPSTQEGTAMTQTFSTPPNMSVSTKELNQQVSVKFYHGLGDCAFFAHLIPLYKKRGIDITVECTPDKRILFESAGATVITNGAEQEHPWGYPAEKTHAGQGHFWQGSKMGHNISEHPLPDIGDKAELWDEYCQTKIDIQSHLSPEAVQTARRYLEPLTQPIVLLHTKGNTGQDRKSLPDAITKELYRALIDQFDGTLILLDWDQRVPRMASYRVRHLDDLGVCSTEVLLAMMIESNLMIGVDSGPLHLARFTETPTVGLWMPGHYPSTYSLPREQQLNVVLSDHTRQWNRFKRIPWNLYEHPGNTFDPEILADICHRMLSQPRYLSPNQITSDVQLQQFVLQFCKGGRSNSLSPSWDRNRSFDVLFQETVRRFKRPIVVETGTIRAEEDWAGAGFFTYLAGAFLSQIGGTLHTVDINPNSCRFAKEWTAVFGETVQVHQQDSIQFLKEYSGQIDVLFLDSLDTTEPRHAEHALEELQAGLPKLHDKSIIILDDTPWNAGAFTGKGAMAVPWLLKHGWVIGYAGYQVVLWREGSQV